MTKTNTKAFTLIELLIVIVIIGILAVALIPRLTGAQVTARNTARKATLQQAASIISSFTSQETSPAMLTASGTPIASTTTIVATGTSAYGNFPTTGANNSVMIASGNNNTYTVCIELEGSKANGNVHGGCSRTDGTGANIGDVSATYTGYAIRVQS